MRHNSIPYIVGFAGVICIVCALFVSASAVLLKDRQDANALLEDMVRHRKGFGVQGAAGVTGAVGSARRWAERPSRISGRTRSENVPLNEAAPRQGRCARRRRSDAA